MRARSTVRWTFGGARGQIRTLISLAPCPVEDCPVGGCLRRFPPSTFNRSLRFSYQPHFPFGNFHPNRVNRSLPQSARNNGADFPFSHLFQVQNSPRLPFWELTVILVHGYDTTSGLSQSGVLVRGARPRAPLMDHDISPPNSSDSMEDGRPHRRGGGSLRWGRRRERTACVRTAARPVA